MTSKNEWNPSKYDNPSDAAKLHFWQIPIIPIATTDSFYDAEGDIWAHKRNLMKSLVSAMNQVQVTE